jgi:uncharacterized protein YjbI with pentapeptide repeats
MVGIHFENCKALGFAIQFNECTLSVCSFYQMKLKNCQFNHSSLIEVDFTDADLMGIIFNHCNVAGTIFENTNLEKANFTTAKNYTINPNNNKIKKAKFSLPEIIGLVHHLNIVIE